MVDHLSIHRIFQLGIVLLILMIVTGGPLAHVPIAHAQEGEPEIIHSHDAEVVFPAVIRFPLRLLVSTDELSGLALTISQEERILRIGDIDIVAAVDPLAVRCDNFQCRAQAAGRPMSTADLRWIYMSGVYKE